MINKFLFHKIPHIAWKRNSTNDVNFVNFFFLWNHCQIGLSIEFINTTICIRKIAEKKQELVF